MKVKHVILANQPENSENFERFSKIVEEKKISVIVAKKGDIISIEKNISFKVLWPEYSNFIDENKLNNNAFVVKLCYQNFSCLFTGDIEKEAEEMLTQLYGSSNELKATMIKVAHHGSKSSSTANFLNGVSPKIAFISVGRHNLYGHPSQEVIERLEESGAKIYRTDKQGEISIKVDKKGRVKIRKFIKNE